MNDQPVEQPTRPRVLLVGDASARPSGLERALTRAGFHLVEREDPGAAPEADAVLITLDDIKEGSLESLLPPLSAESGFDVPRLVILSTANPDELATALALGAADALVAPIHFRELCARLHARIREHQPSDGSSRPAEPVEPPSDPSAGLLNGGQPDPNAAPGTPEISELLDHRVQEEFERARRYSLSFSLILLGIEGLWDSGLEPEAAERLRGEVGRTLRRELRVPDLVVPYGPEEFALVLPETGPAGARQSVMRVRERLMSLPFDGDHRVEPTRFSAGIVTYPHPAAFETDDLFAMVEAALMRGKAQAGERIGVAV